MMLLKPSKLDRLIRRQQGRVSAEALKRKLRRTEMAREREIRMATYERDKGLCRAYGVPVNFAGVDPLRVAHCHHFKYRSAGGSDDISNRITLSPQAHDLEHRHLLHISGDPNGTLEFALYDAEGEFIGSWESPCPS